MLGSPVSTSAPHRQILKCHFCCHFHTLDKHNFTQEGEIIPNFALFLQEKHSILNNPNIFSPLIQQPNPCSFVRTPTTNTRPYTFLCPVSSDFLTSIFPLLFEIQKKRWILSPGGLAIKNNFSGLWLWRCVDGQCYVGQKWFICLLSYLYERQILISIKSGHPQGKTPLKLIVGAFSLYSPHSLSTPQPSSSPSLPSAPSSSTAEVSPASLRSHSRNYWQVWWSGKAQKVCVAQQQKPNCCSCTQFCISLDTKYQLQIAIKQQKINEENPLHYYQRQFTISDNTIYGLTSFDECGHIVCDRAFGVTRAGLAVFVGKDDKDTQMM